MEMIGATNAITAMIRSTQLIGRVINVVISPLEIVMALRKFVSMVLPRIRPRSAGVVG